MRAPFLLAAIVLLAPFAFAGAALDDVQVGEGWRFIRFESLGYSELGMRVTFEGPSLILGMPYIEGVVGGVGFHILGGADGGAAFDTDAVGAEAFPIITQPSTAQAGFIVSWAHTRDMIILAAGEIVSIEYTVSGPGSYEVLSSGDLHSYTGAELDGGAWAKVSGANAAAHISALRSLEFDIEHTLIGGFAMPPLTGFYPGLMTLSSPSGTDTCGNAALMALTGEYYPFDHIECVPRHFDGPLARGAGHYRLDWTGAAAAYGNTPVAVWADIEWPAAAT